MRKKRIFHRKKLKKGQKRQRKNEKFNYLIERDADNSKKVGSETKSGRSLSNLIIVFSLENN